MSAQADIFFDKTTVVISGKRWPVFRTKCQDCTTTIDYRNNQDRNIHPDIVRKYITRRGWVEDKRNRFTCPKCSTEAMLARRTRTTGTKDMHHYSDDPRTPAAQAPAKPQPAKPAALTPAQTVQVVTAMSLYFDAKARAYTGGYSDERVAAELGLPLDAVRAFRREAYGDLAVPVEIAALHQRMEDSRRQVDGIRTSLDKAIAEQAAIRSALDNYIAANR